MKDLSQTLHLAKNLMDNGYGMLRNYLQYKMEEAGKYFVKVNKWYASTQTCHKCGSRKKISLNEREYHCDDCGEIIDRDINAAINIRNEGMKILSNIV